MDVTANKDGTYSFTMPSGTATVKATFKEAPEDEPGSGVEGPDETDTAALPFGDISPDAWYYPAVTDVFCYGLMKGMSSTTFGPDLQVSRGMLATVLYRLAGETAAGTVPYADVNPDAWYADAIAWCASVGLSNGYDGVHFGPDDVLTREQMATMLFRYAQKYGWAGADADDTELNGYVDATDVDAYATDALAWCVREGILKGTPDAELAPAGDASRAQLAVILDRFCTKFAWESEPETGQP